MRPTAQPGADVGSTSTQHLPGGRQARARAGDALAVHPRFRFIRLDRRGHPHVAWADDAGKKPRTYAATTPPRCDCG
jgi:hypothetical protein